jgi:hypothetical protein
MYRCTVAEKDIGHAERQWDISIDKCKADWHAPEPSSQNDTKVWENIQRKSHASSAAQFYYSINWKYNGKHRTTGLTVFTSDGGPPCDGRIILDTSLATYIQGRFGIEPEPPAKNERQSPAAPDQLR